MYNRRYLEETVVREFHRGKRHNTPVSVLMLDIDHFKMFNDTEGHQAADVMLSNVANTLRSGLRKEDVACRYGGEEFVMILSGATLEDAVKRAHSLRESVYTDSGNRVTISIGVSAFPSHGEVWEELLSAADAALYQAKNNGRNRVEVAPKTVIGAKNEAFANADACAPGPNLPQVNA